MKQKVGVRKELLELSTVLMKYIASLSSDHCE